MTIEREIFGWKFAAAGAAGDLAASCSVLRAARPKTQWTRRLNGPECAGWSEAKFEVLLRIPPRRAKTRVKCNLGSIRATTET